MENHNHTYAVLLAGGGGTRLWPKSRNKTPKQFLKLTGDRTMMQEAGDRLHKMMAWDHIIVVTNKLYEDDVKQQLPDIPEQNIIAEPAKKDTALAMLVGALYAKSLDPHAVIMNAASDHTLTDVNEYVRVMQKAVEVASGNDYLVTVGITPSEPNTGFGYIKAGEDLKRLNHGLSLFKVDNFTEKPNLPTAIGYISTGKYFWNANMYVWSAEAIQKAFAKHMPELHKLTKDLVSMDHEQFHQALPEIYDQAEKISIDYAISEKADNLVLIPGDFGWNDVGYWKVVYDLGDKNADGNVVVSDQEHNQTVAVNSNNNLVHTDNRLVALLDVNDMVVVDTDEILLIAPKNKSQEVKKIVNKLKDEERDEYL
jgi:mannose-1-phosphate guanylyltransferase